MKVKEHNKVGEQYSIVLIPQTKREQQVLRRMYQHHVRENALNLNAVTRHYSHVIGLEMIGVIYNQNTSPSIVKKKVKK